MSIPSHRTATASLLVLLLAACPGWAHTVWLEPVPGENGIYRVAFGGHEGKEEPYPPEKLKRIDAFDPAGDAVTASHELSDAGVRIHAGSEVAMIALFYDNGIWATVPGERSVNRPLNEVAGATAATNALKYHKTVMQWTPAITRPIGQPFELVPVDSTPPVPGQPMKLRVLIDGEPAVGIAIGQGENDAQGPTTDENGVVEYTPRAGANRVWAGKRIDVAGNPAFTVLSYEYLFGFDLP